ncbi:MAG: glycosyltransferase family 1 protein [Candidatus Magasanikbacteria bacterium]|nr:glycosyltransferase family 1 protein [Candidatus Magasanikbacteria bacterium]
MNIGIDIRPLMTKNKTGVGEYTYELLNAVFKLDNKNQYYLFYNASRSYPIQALSWQKENVHYVESRYPNKFFNLALQLKLIKIDQFLPVKINYWYAPNLNFFHLSSNIPYALTIHDLSFEIFPQFYTAKQNFWHKIIAPKNQTRHAQMIIVPSENTKRDLENYYKIPKEKIKVIYPGVDDSFSLNNPSLKIDKTRVLNRYNLPENFILFLGSIEPRKNIITIIRAYEKLPPEISNKYSLLIVGAPGWKNKEIYDAAQKSPLASQIKFIGYIAANDKPIFYQSSSLFIFDSFYEGFGFPLIEAMRMGTATIAANRASLPEITQDASYLVNPNKITDLCIAIKTLLTDQELKNNYIKKGHIVAERYSWEKAAATWLAAIENTI